MTTDGLPHCVLRLRVQVRGFLNVLGPWDPSLACVMGAGAGLSLMAHQLAQRHERVRSAWSGPWLAGAYAYPLTCEFGTAGKGRAPLCDGRLLGGALLFGFGWGAVGICPGPSIVGLASPLVGGAVPGEPWRFPLFVLASLVGMELAEGVLGAAPTPPPSTML